MMNEKTNPLTLRERIKLTLQEDLGSVGDVTSLAPMPSIVRGSY